MKIASLHREVRADEAIRRKFQGSLPEGRISAQSVQVDEHGGIRRDVVSSDFAGLEIPMGDEERGWWVDTERLLNDVLDEGKVRHVGFFD